MPHTVNGIGTWYYGRQHQFRHRRTCDSCNGVYDLASYDTVMYFTVFFVPIIPLVKYRIIDDCPGCRKHRSVKLKQWYALKKEAQDKAFETLENAPNDPKSIIEAYGMATAFHDEPLLLDLRDDYNPRFQSNPEVQTVLGSCLRQCSRFEEAEEAFKASLAQKDDLQVRELLGVVQMCLRKVDEAEETVAPVLELKQPDKSYLHWWLIESHQELGEHDRAIEHMDRMVELRPELVKDADYKKRRKFAEKNLSTEKPFRATVLPNPKQLSAYSHSSRTSRVAGLISPLVIAALLLLYIGSAMYTARNRTVYVVNGLSKPYKVSINGSTVDVSPDFSRKLTVAEGTLNISVEGANGKIAPQTVELRTPLWSRPFVSRTFVVNPDRSAVLDNETAYYAANVADRRPNQSNYKFGQLFYEFSGLDHEFAEFPAEIKREGKGVFEQSRIDLVRIPTNSPDGAYMTLQGIDAQVANASKAILKSRLEIEPENDILLAVALHGLSPTEIIEYVKPRLSDRPALIFWHRWYQNAVERGLPAHDLSAEYRALHEAAPEDKSIITLYARTLMDDAVRVPLMEKAASDPDPIPYAHVWLGQHKALMGDFDAAYQTFEKSLTPSMPLGIAAEPFRELLFCAGRYEQVHSLAAEGDSTFNGFESLKSWTWRLRCDAAQGDEAAAERRFESARQQLTAMQLDHQVVDRVVSGIKDVWLYAKGDIDSLMAAEEARNVPEPGEEGPAPQPSFVTALHKWDLTAAADSLASITEAERWEVILRRRLTLHLAGVQAGNTEFADQQLAVAVDVLKNVNNPWAKELAAALEPNAPQPNPAVFLTLHCDLELKPVILATLGTKFPALKPQCFELARKLNVLRVEPWLFMKKYLDSAM